MIKTTKIIFSFFILFIAINSCSTKEEEVVSFDIFTSINPEEGGNVTPMEGSFLSDTEVKIIATANEGFAFRTWTGASNDTSSSIALTMDSNKQLTAIFEKLDSDEDGVSDNLDECLNTDFGETVDSEGCSASQIDISNSDLYLFKKHFVDYKDQVSLIKYDLDNSKETIVYSLSTDFVENESISRFGRINSVFLPSNNEIITIDTFKNSLLRVNISDGTETIHKLTDEQYVNYNGLTITDNEDIYLFKRNYENNNDQVSLVKYDLNNSTETIVYSLGNDFDESKSFSRLGGINSAFLPSNNEIITIDTSERLLLRVNLSDGTETTHKLTDEPNVVNYEGLIITNNEDIYLFKRNYANNNDQISLVKYDIDNSKETIVYSLGTDFVENESFRSQFGGINALFLPNRNEIITMDTFKNSLLRVNISDGIQTKNKLNDESFVSDYNGLIIN